MEWRFVPRYQHKSIEKVSMRVERNAHCIAHIAVDTRVKTRQSFKLAYMDTRGDVYSPSRLFDSQEFLILLTRVHPRVFSLLALPWMPGARHPRLEVRNYFRPGDADHDRYYVDLVPFKRPTPWNLRNNIVVPYGASRTQE